MSGGYSCHCVERRKPASERCWRVLDFKCNHSAFNGSIPPNKIFPKTS